MYRCAPHVLTSEGFAAALGTASSTATPQQIFDVLSGAAASSSLKVGDAVKVLSYLASRDLDAAVAAATGDTRTKVRDLILNRRTQRQRARADADAEAREWTVDEVVAELVALEADGAALKWPSVRNGAGTAVVPHIDVRLAALFELFAGASPTLSTGVDADADSDALVAAAVAVGPLVDKMWGNDFRLLWTSPAAIAAPKASALMATLLLARSRVPAAAVASMPVPFIDDVADVAGRLAPHAEAFADLSAAAAQMVVTVSLSAAYALAGRRNGARSAASVFGVEHLRELDDDALSALVKRMRGPEVSEDTQPAAQLAAVLTDAVVGATRPRDMKLPSLRSDTLRMLSPATYFSYSRPAPSAPAKAAGVWADAALDLFEEGAPGWDVAGFFDAADRFGDAVAAATERLTDTGAYKRSASLPPEIIEWAQRRGGLDRWIRSDAATREALASAGRHLSVEQWSTVWTLSERFSGTVDELVAVAVEAAP
jgi:hypothetical protein